MGGNLQNEAIDNLAVAELQAGWDLFLEPGRQTRPGLRPGGAYILRAGISAVLVAAATLAFGVQHTFPRAGETL